jgi:hypothetical protein
MERMSSPDCLQKTEERAGGDQEPGNKMHHVNEAVLA